LSWLTVEIVDQVLPQRVHRNNPTVVKKPVSKYEREKGHSPEVLEQK
jgi:hypothetical protein